MIMEMVATLMHIAKLASLPLDELVIVINGIRFGTYLSADKISAKN